MAQKPPDHQITVTPLDDGTYQYTDARSDGTTVASKYHHVKNNETISWRSDDGDLTIYFPDKNPIGDPNPFTIPNHLPSIPRKLHGKKSDPPCKYEVTIQGFETEDPYVLFDDGLLDVSTETIDVQALKTIAQETTDSIEAIITMLTLPEEGAPQHDKRALFFPHGITSIAVNLTVGPATVGITVKGPDSEG